MIFVSLHNIYFQPWLLQKMTEHQLICRGVNVPYRLRIGTRVVFPKPAKVFSAHRLRATKRYATMAWRNRVGGISGRWIFSRCLHKVKDSWYHLLPLNFTRAHLLISNKRKEFPTKDGDPLTWWIAACCFGHWPDIWGTDCHRQRSYKGLPTAAPLVKHGSSKSVEARQGRNNSPLQKQEEWTW